MREFLSLVISGAVSGALYAIVASGLVLTFQTSGILNFAHGAVAFVTAYLFYILHTPTSSGGLGVPVALAAFLSVALFAPLLGWSLDRVMLRRLADAPETARVVGTIGLLVAMPALAIFLVERLNAIFHLGLPGNDQVYNPAGIGPRPKHAWSITRGVVIDSDQLVVLAAAALAAICLWFVLRHTRLGLETRARVDRKSLAELRGVNTDRVGAISSMLSFMLAGLGGVLIAPLFDLTPITYNLIIFATFTAVVFAGMRSIPLAFAGGLLLGVVQNLVYGYAPNFLAEVSGFRSVLPFALLLLFLLVISQRRGRATGVAAEERRPTDHRDGLSAIRRRLPWLVATAGLAVYVLFTADDFWASLAAKGLALGLVFLSFVVVTGIGGMISLAQPAFVTAGAFAAGWLLNHRWSQTTPVLMHNGHVSFIVAAIAAALVATAVGVLVALPSLRVGGLALALATLALAFIGGLLVFQLTSVSNGSSGWTVPAPKLWGIDFGNARAMSMLLLVICLAIAYLISNLVRSPSGRAILAVRSTDVAARTAGISPVRAKLGLFAMSAAIAGFGGVMYAAVSSPFTNTTAPAFTGVIWLAVVVTFGVRRPAGAILAGLSVAMFPSVIDWVTTSSFAWTVLFTLGVGLAGGYLLGAALHKHSGRGIPEPTRLSIALLIVALLALLAASVSGNNELLYIAVVIGGLLIGLPAGERFAAAPSVRAAAGMLVGAGLLIVPMLVTWSNGATAAGHLVADGIGSTQFPTILFGLGAIGLAANPNGVLAMGGERLRAQRLLHEKASPAPASTTSLGTPLLRGLPDQRKAAVPVAVTRETSPGGTTDAAPPALRMTGVVAGWGEVEVLHGVDLDVQAGAIVVLLGANGAGKSTLCQVAAGLLPARSGRVELKGRDITSAPAYQRARTGLMLAPEGRGIFPALTVEENLALWLRDPAERRRAYDRFPILGTRRKQPAGLMSGGEQQMLALASALEHPPGVLIADEPSFGLAPFWVRDVYEALVELRDRGVALLLVEEKVQNVLGVADTVALMSLGRIQWTGPREQADPGRLAAAYLGA